MVVDRVHRARRLLGDGAKTMLRDLPGGGPVEIHVGGVVLNHLGWASVLGVRAGIFGRQGDDADGRFLRAAMDRAGIARDITLTSAATSLAEIFVDDTGARAIYMAPAATAETTEDHVRNDHAAFIRTAERLTTEVSQLPLVAALAALEIARGAGVATLVDLDVPEADALATLGDQATFDAVLGAADLLKPAKLAAREIVPEAGSDPLAIARAMRARYGNDTVVVTDGEAGCAIASGGYEGVIPAFAADVVDTTGAGDAFVGGLLAGLQRGLDWPSIGRLANAAGAACVERLGAFPADVERARRRVDELLGG
jgi:ribokinase